MKNLIKLPQILNYKLYYLYLLKIKLIFYYLFNILYFYYNNKYKLLDKNLVNIFKF